MLFSKVHKKSELAIVFDVGSASVGGALIELAGNAKPKIIYTVRKQMRVSKKFDSARFFSSMINALEFVALNLEKEGLNHLNFTKMGSEKIKNCHIVLASPWYLSQNNLITYKKESEFIVTEELLDKIASSKLESGNEESDKDTKRSRSLIEKQIVQIKLNGYVTDEPVQKTAKFVEISLFGSLISKKIQDDLSSLIKKIFVSSNVRFHTYVLASFYMIRELFLNHDDFLFMDITGEVTDISLVINGVLLSTVSFPLGKNHVIRDVAMIMKATPETALSHISMSYGINAKKQPDESLEKILKQFKNKWISELDVTMTSFANQASLPKKIFITGDNDTGNLFVSFLKTESFGQLHLIDHKYDISFLNERVINDKIVINQKISHDFFLFFETLFLNEKYNETLHW